MVLEQRSSAALSSARVRVAEKCANDRLALVLGGTANVAFDGEKTRADKRE
jgi:hypothetical protein